MSKYYKSGSYKNVAFEYIDDKYAYRLKEAEQSFISADTETETLSAEPRSFNLTVCVYGSNAAKQRDDLIKALEDPKSGILVHPQFGRISVKVEKDGFEVTSSADKGNYYEFSINFIKVDADKLKFSVMPVSANPKDALLQAINEATNATTDNFTDKVKVKGWLESVADDAASMAQKVASEISKLTSAEVLPFSTVAQIKGSIDTLSGSAGSLLNYPDKFVAAVMNALSYEGATYNFFKRLAAISFTPNKPKYLTETRKQSIINQQSIVNLVVQVAVIKACETGSEIENSSETEIAKRIEELTNLVETVIDNPLNADNFEIQSRFEKLLQSGVSALHAQTASKTKTITPADTIPAVVLLYQVGGKKLVNQSDTFQNRNKIKNPLFITGGQSVEVAYD